jgi:peptidoglycan/LPS O-acetylase OafA/YrhL
MNPINPLPALVAIVVAVSLSGMLKMRHQGGSANADRYASIDGLRGYLAFFVFLHHAAIWFFYLRTGSWQVPPSNFYTQLGQASVVLFFMITGFLFFSKLLDARKKNIDWEKLYVSRVLRLTPLYLVSMVAFLFIVAVLSDWQLKDPSSRIAKDAIRWLGFTILGTPKINGIDDAFIILAGVTWSLPYEWFFYFSLPVLSLLTGGRPSLVFRLIGVASLVAFLLWQPLPYHVLPFLGGMLAALGVRVERLRRRALGPEAGLIASLALFTAYAGFPTAYAFMPQCLLGLAFFVIACGSTLFGMLRTRGARALGELTYSVYLLHGILLFVFFRFIVGIDAARMMSPSAHWAAIIAMTPVLLGMCWLSYHLIELPAMRAADRVTRLLQSVSFPRQPEVHGYVTELPGPGK